MKTKIRRRHRVTRVGLPSAQSRSWQFFGDPEFLKLLAEILTEVMDFDMVSLYVFDQASGKLVVVMQRGEGINPISAVRFELGRGLSAWVAQKKRIVHLPNIHRGARHAYHPVRSFLALPLMIGEEVLGVLNVAHTVPNTFRKPLVAKLQRLSGEIAQLIYRWGILTREHAEESEGGSKDFSSAVADSK